jgi:hypothetical protein
LREQRGDERRKPCLVLVLDGAAAAHDELRADERKAALLERDDA